MENVMRVRSVLFVMGVLLACMGVSLVLPIGVSLWYGDGATPGLVASFVIIVVGGLCLAYVNRADEPLILSNREGFAAVGLCWMAAALAGALPYLLSSQFSLTNAVFESASGFTTTGATIMRDIEAMPKGLLMWRSLTHWLGGLGIILLSLVILPLLGVGGMQLYKAEVTGPTPDKLTPRMHDTALMLWKVYGLMTVALIGLLWFEGMDLFDAVNHAFATVATGGFSTKNASIAAFPSPAIQWTLIVFMFLAGMNFALHYRFLLGNFGVYFRDRECVCYALLLFIGSIAVTASLIAGGIFPDISAADLEAATRAAVFQLVSLCTTTGFVTENFSLWPSFTLMLFILFMFMGGCGGSTAGGLKTMRLMLLWRMAYEEIFRLLHPHSVRHLKVGGRTVPPDVLSGVGGFFLLYLALLVATTLVLTLLDFDLITAFTATLTCLSNVGPGLGSVGPVDTFDHLPALAKWLLSVCMLLGRLEIYAILVLFVPEFWRH